MSAAPPPALPPVPPLAAVAHELRTPLHGILGCAALLAATPLDAEQRAHLGALTEAARALAAFADDALALARLHAEAPNGGVPNAGTPSTESPNGSGGPAAGPAGAAPAVVPVRPAPCDVRAVLAGAARTLAPAAAARGLALDARADDAVPAAAVLDGARVREVLLNLGANAVRATRRGGVRLRARVEPGDDGDTWLALAVADDGPGMTAARQARLFRPWAPGDGEAGGGAGIGLVLAQALAARLGGTVAVESAPGRGSTFTLRVPLEVAPAPATPAAQPRPARRRHSGP